MSTFNRNRQRICELPGGKRQIGRHRSARAGLLLALIGFLAGCQPIALRSGSHTAEECPIPVEPKEVVQKELRVVEKKVPSLATVLLQMRAEYCVVESAAQTPKEVEAERMAMAKKLRRSSKKVSRNWAKDLSDSIVLSCELDRDPTSYLVHYDVLATKKGLNPDARLLLDMLAKYGRRVVQLENEKEAIRHELQQKIDALTAIEKEINAR